MFSFEIHFDVCHACGTSTSAVRKVKTCSGVLTIRGNRSCSERVKQRLALYQGVIPIYMQLSDDAEETFSRATSSLMVSPFVRHL
jgi:pyruvate kinase